MTKERNICASCIGMDFQNHVVVSDQKLPKWLENYNYVKNFIEKSHEFKLKRKKTKTFPISLHVPDHKNKFVLYWAAMPSKNEMKIIGAKEAYGAFTNSGVSKVDSKGNVTFHIQCPQNYRAILGKKEDIFYRHVHFCFEKDKVWDKDHIFTKVITCDVKMRNLKCIYSDNNKKCQPPGYILINTLSKADYDKKHIPGSIHLDADTVKSMDSKQCENFFKKIIRTTPHLKKAVQQKDLFWYSIPIILYCKNKQCHASDRCLKELYEKGMVNVKILRQGMGTL